MNLLTLWLIGLILVTCSS